MRLMINIQMSTFILVLIGHPIDSFLMIFYHFLYFLFITKFRSFIFIILHEIDKLFTISYSFKFI